MTGTFPNICACPPDRSYSQIYDIFSLHRLSFEGINDVIIVGRRSAWIRLDI